MSANHGWISLGPRKGTEGPGDAPTRIEQATREQDERRGALLAVVEVRVYEHDEMPYVTFPTDAVLGVESEASVISEVVSRAREQLRNWR